MHKIIPILKKALYYISLAVVFIIGTYFAKINNPSNFTSEKLNNFIDKSFDFIINSLTAIISNSYIINGIKILIWGYIIYAIYLIIKILIDTFHYSKKDDNLNKDFNDSNDLK